MAAAWIRATDGRHGQLRMISVIAPTAAEVGIARIAGPKFAVMMVAASADSRRASTGNRVMTDEVSANKSVVRTARRSAN